MSESARPSNHEPAEIRKFEALASRWWDPHSEFKPLHEINPLRMGFITRKVTLAGKRVLDIGCGGGILSEAMARQGADVSAIDLADASLAVAKLHQLESGLSIHYEKLAAEDMAAREPGSFDVVTCLEMLEHVPDPAAIVQACATLVKPGGHVFISTINRNPKAYLFAILGAEYILNLLPRGTHDYAKFIKPSELYAWTRDAGLDAGEVTGMAYNPLTKRYSLESNVDVNYLGHFVRPATAEDSSAQ